MHNYLLLDFARKWAHCVSFVLFRPSCLLSRIAPTAERESGKTDGLFFDLSYNEAFEVNSSALLMFLWSRLPSLCVSAVVVDCSL